MLRISILAAVAFSFLLLAGCGKSTYEYTDSKDVKIDAINHVEDGDFLIVTAVLENKSSSAINHSVYRMLWFDTNGVLIEQSSWRPVIVKGGAQVYIKERSTVPGAMEYKLLLSNDAS